MIAMWGGGTYEDLVQALGCQKYPFPCLPSQSLTFSNWRFSSYLIGKHFLLPPSFPSLFSPSHPFSSFSFPSLHFLFFVFFWSASIYCNSAPLSKIVSPLDYRSSLLTCFLASIWPSILLSTQGILPVPEPELAAFLCHSLQWFLITFRTFCGPRCDLQGSLWTVFW